MRHPTQQPVPPVFRINLTKVPSELAEWPSEPSAAADAPAAAALPLLVEPFELEIRAGCVLMVAGPNGVGKSALLGEIARGIGHSDVVETFFGSRQIQFANEEVDQVGQGLKQFQLQINSNVTRFRHPWGEQHLKSVVRRVLNLELQTNSDIVRLAEQGAEIEKAKEGLTRPIFVLNEIFSISGLPIAFCLEDGMLKAKRGASSYGIDRLSDGERAALLVAGAVVIRPKGTYIVIDEPERHLNPAISGPFLSALIRARSDLGFILSTHDLQLLEWLQPDQVLHVRDSTLIQENPEQRRYDLSLISAPSEIPEELKIAVLGARKKLLLVEGTSTSEDQSLYRLCYPDWHVVAKGGWESVASGVKALSRSDEYHWLIVAGLIDADGRSAEEKDSLLEESVYALPSPTIENIFLNPFVISEMAASAADHFGGPSAEARIESAVEALRICLVDGMDEIIARRTAWEVNRRISGLKVSVREVREGADLAGPIDILGAKADIETELNEIVSEGISLSLLTKLPIKNSPIPTKISKSLGYHSFTEYKSAVLRQIEIGTAHGKNIKSWLKSAIPTVAEA
jgi:energy-coupling factor transporter ATP-binding protein EcfA2